MQIDETFTHDPLAPHSAQFPLNRGEHAAGQDAPSAPGIRPWNLRAMTAPAQQAEPQPIGEYDPARQIRVDIDGRPLLEMGPPTAPTTGSQDGSEGDPSEDYHND